MPTLLVLAIYSLYVYPCNKVDGLTTVDSSSTRKYVIVFDAGSTGTRMHIFQFALGNALKLLNGTFFHTKPGLSSFAYTPHKCVKQLREMLDRAVQLIPENSHMETYLSLKATAGLRLLSKKQVTQIFAEVLELFKLYPFNIGKRPIQVISGKEEGILSWITVNFLKGIFNKERDEWNISTTGAIDLGGASTQITFLPLDKKTVVTSLDFVQEIKLLNYTFNLYSHSYLGYGLKTARLAMFGRHNNPLAQTSKKDENILKTPCLLLNQIRNWTFSGNDYLVRGLSKLENRFDNCLTAAYIHIKNNFHKYPEITHHRFYGFSYLFDQLYKADLFGEDGGLLQVELIRKAALTECNRRVVVKYFLCTDLCYICALLQQGFGLTENSKIHIIKQVDGYEASWALGSAIMLLTDP